MAEPVYVWREDIEDSLDVKPTAYMGPRIDRACAAGSRMVDSFCHRTFYPEIATRTFDYPGPRSTALRLWLDEHELVSATEVSSDGDVIPASTGYLLRPDDGPPYDLVEINRDNNYAWASGPQRAISITGLWAYQNSETLATTLDAAISSTSATTIDVNRPAGGIGALLRIGAERMFVTGKSWTDSGSTAPTLTAAANAVTLAGIAGAATFTQNEIILIDSERMRIVDIAGTTLTVQRAIQGSTLAAHTVGATIYWQHRLTVERGVLGTTAATAADEASVYRWVPPSAVQSLAHAYAEEVFLQENAGYARVAGSGDNERPVTGQGIGALERRVSGLYRRQGRRLAV